jgi:hypothetical protein
MIGSIGLDCSRLIIRGVLLAFVRHAQILRDTNGRAKRRGLC